MMKSYNIIRWPPLENPTLRQGMTATFYMPTVLQMKILHVSFLSNFEKRYCPNRQYGTADSGSGALPKQADTIIIRII